MPQKKNGPPGKAGRLNLSLTKKEETAKEEPATADNDRKSDVAVSCIPPAQIGNVRRAAQSGAGITAKSSPGADAADKAEARMKSVQNRIDTNETDIDGIDGIDGIYEIYETRYIKRETGTRRIESSDKRQNERRTPKGRRFIGQKKRKSREG